MPVPSITTTLATLLLATAAAHADILDVCDTCQYTTIKNAVNAAGNGDTIMIAAGTYNEQNIDTKRSITI